MQLAPDLTGCEAPAAGRSGHPLLGHDGQRAEPLRAEALFLIPVGRVDVRHRGRLMSVEPE